MRILVSGSSGHLGEALMRVLPGHGHEVVGLDILDSPFTGLVGSIADRDRVRAAVAGVDAVVHSATLHKPHVDSHGRQEFIDTNITGTLNLLEESVAAGVGRLIFVSTTSAFGRALVPADGEPAAWITEDVQPIPRNIYGATKRAAEDLCQLIAQDDGLPVLVLRTSRFFPELDDVEAVRAVYPNLNLKVNELLHRRVDIADIVDAVELALDRAPSIGFGRYIITATTPFGFDDRRGVREDLPAVVARLYPSYEEIYAGLGWKMFPSIDRIYVNERARRELGWTPRWGFGFALERLAAGEDPRSPLTIEVGAKGYHAESTGVYTVR
jgi:UDP-glucose 4-epimerase